MVILIPPNKYSANFTRMTFSSVSKGVKQPPRTQEICFVFFRPPLFSAKYFYSQQAGVIENRKLAICELNIFISNSKRTKDRQKDESKIRFIAAIDSARDWA